MYGIKINQMLANIPFMGPMLDVENFELTEFGLEQKTRIKGN